jgi:hypothetical protein
MSRRYAPDDASHRDADRGMGRGGETKASAADQGVRPTIYKE